MTSLYKNITQLFNADYAMEMRTEEAFKILFDTGYDEQIRHFDKFCRLVDKGVASDIEKDDFNLLHAAIDGDLSEAAQYLINAGFDVNKVASETQDTALMLSIYSNDMETFNLLMSKKPDLNAQNYVGSTALHISLSHQNIDACKILLLEGADETIQDQDNETVFDCISEMKDPLRQAFETVMNEHIVKKEQDALIKKTVMVEKSLSTQTEIKRKRLHLNGARKMS